MSCVVSSNLIFAARRFRRMTVEVGSWRSGKIKPRTVQLAKPPLTADVSGLLCIYSESTVRCEDRRSMFIGWLIPAILTWKSETNTGDPFFFGIRQFPSLGESGLRCPMYPMYPEEYLQFIVSICVDPRVSKKCLFHPYYTQDDYLK